MALLLATFPLLADDVPPDPRFDTVLSGRTLHHYDEAAGTYAPYTGPKGPWLLSVDQCSRLPKRARKLIRQDVGPNGRPRTTSIVRPTRAYPQDALAYRWAVKRQSEVPVITEIPVADEWVDAEGPEACKAVLKLDGAGAYRISLDILSADGRMSSHTEFRHFRHFLIVSAGDSYASGEGNPDRPGDYQTSSTSPFDCDDTTLVKAADLSLTAVTPARWIEKRAHRSFHSGPAMAAHTITRGHDLVTFISVASSGAQVKVGLLSPQWQRVGQIEEVKRIVGDATIDALIISIGGNDVGFAGTLESLAKWGDSATAIAAAEEKLLRLPDDLASVKRKIEDLELNVRRVYLTEYPTAFFDNTSGFPVEGCGVFSTLWDGVSGQDARRISTFAAKLNTTLATTVETLEGWTFVDGIAALFKRRGYCAKDTFFVGAEESCRSQGDFNGTMHPNSGGQRAYATRIAAKLLADLPPAPKTATGRSSKTGR